MINQQRPLRRAVLGAGAVIGTAAAGVLFAVPANAAPPPTITFTEGVLSIVGDAGNNTLVVGSTPAGTITLNGTEVLGGAPTRANVSLVHVDGGAGDDTLKFDETNGAMPRGEFIGGEGRNSITGGSGADTIVGGGGIDRVNGGLGDDTVSLGDGSDQFTWNVGDGNDHVDGGAGLDTLIFNGNDAVFESVFIGHFRGGPRFSISRSGDPFQPFTEVDGSGFESVKTLLAGGVDNVGVSDLTGAGVGVLRVDLGPATDASAGGGPFFQDASIFGTDGPDRIRIGGTPAAGVTVAGLAPTVIVTGAKDVDVWGSKGDDIIDASRLAAGTVTQLREFGVFSSFGPPQHDTLIGHPGNDLLQGGPGDDRLEGRGGVDVLDGGGGNDVIIP